MRIDKEHITEETVENGYTGCNKEGTTENKMEDACQRYLESTVDSRRVNLRPKTT